jgi:acetyltransferase-like isoleucine patch superfamily enzyme
MALKINNKIRSVKLRIKRILWLCRGVKLGKKAFIHKQVDISNASRVSLKTNAVLYKNVTLYIGNSGRFELGKNSHIAPYGYALIADNKLIIGDNVAIGPFCSLFCHSNSMLGKSSLFCENYLDNDIFIGNNVFIGSHCVILPGTIIHDNVVIAANSVVKGEIMNGNLYGGSPAKLIKSIDNE